MSLKGIGSEKISLTDMQCPKTVCLRIEKSPVAQDTLKSRLVNSNKHCSNMENATINSYLSLCRQLRLRKSLLLICKVLTLFLKALTGRDRYCLDNRGNLQQPFQMRVSEKEEMFSNFSFSFLKFPLNFEHFLKKEQPHS